MDWTPLDIENKRFRTSWRGYDKREVELFLHQLAEDLHRLQLDRKELEKELHQLRKENAEHRDREKAIRNVLFNAQKATEQIKANAEKEAKLIIADAELKAEKILQTAHQRLAQLHEDIHELKRQRTQLETKLRSTIETYRQLLDMEKEDGDAELENKIKFLNR
ncbi:cell division initiation protein [Desulfacinum hydrothermale DSM 13146]|uniref:Cell division initiation protein n=1 Tax=Desulfacinum hydrothermale DSM 13146 TaxID=1121390 RepID=A0A1W1XSL2_9BACT|nr:DivIVA domain-containing protein [Desulfacinum hydrothermale]SMC26887.1 cell division initiation protein [Desulfacinum hydrothermale DSM 13146]